MSLFPRDKLEMEHIKRTLSELNLSHRSGNHRSSRITLSHPVFPGKRFQFTLTSAEHVYCIPVIDHTENPSLYFNFKISLGWKCFLARDLSGWVVGLHLKKLHHLEMHQIQDLWEISLERNWKLNLTTTCTVCKRKSHD